MQYFIMTGVMLIAVYFCTRWLLLKHSIRKMNPELNEIIENITENRILKMPVPEKELEELLITMNHALYSVRQERIHFEQREKEFRKQIENISHDIRTPLTSILGYLEIINTEYMTQEDGESLAVVKRKAYSLQRLTNQFYDLSRLVGEDYILKAEPSDIGPFLRESILGHYKVLSAAGLDVEVCIPDKKITVLIDKDAVERIFANLLENASRYAESTLKVRLEEDNGKIIIVFENDTQIHQKEDVSQLFERFFRSDSARNSEGTGLGLTIAKHLAERMEGTLSAELYTEHNRNWLRIILVLNCM